MFPVSFIIPMLNEQAGIADLLCDLRQRYPDAELVVVDGGSSDQSAVRAIPLCDQFLLGDPGRALQMNLGARVASGQYLCFLHADSRPGCSAEEFQQYFQREPQWGFCRVRLSGKRWVFRLIEWCMNQRSRITRIATGDQMLFMRRQLFLAAGGFPEIPLMEDIALCKAMRRHSPPLVVSQPVVTSSRRWEEGGVVTTVLRMWALRLAYLLGVPPRRLWHYYYAR